MKKIKAHKDKANKARVKNMALRTLIFLYMLKTEQKYSKKVTHLNNG